MDDVDAITLSYTLFAAAGRADKPVARAPEAPGKPRTKFARGDLTARAKHSNPTGDRADTGERGTMADAHAKPHHDYHLVNPSPWPLIGVDLRLPDRRRPDHVWMKHLEIGGLKLGGLLLGVGFARHSLSILALVDRCRPRGARTATTRGWCRSAFATA